VGADENRPPIDWGEALQLHGEGWTYADIAREFGYAYQTVRMKLRAMGAPPRRPSRRRQTIRGKKLLEIWRFMREKCLLPGHPSYRHYGAKGATVCRQWDESFDTFHDWAVSNGYSSGLRLSRKSRSRGFSPGNCRWVTATEKVRRRQGQRRPSWTLTAFGETKGPAEWSRDPRCMVSAKTLKYRIRRGDSPEKAITAPPDSTRKPGAASPPPLPRRRKSIDWDEASRLYLEEGLSQPDVARRVGASYTGVVAAFKRLGVHRERQPAPTSTPEGRRLHKTWQSLHRRCSDSSDTLFPYNGAKGIKVCREWSLFSPFLTWALATGAKRGLCLIRLEASEDYSPKNCAWMTRTEASRRSRPPSRPHPPRRPITAFGEAKGVVAWSKDARCSVSSTTISSRLDRGWDAVSAITSPAENRGGSETVYTELEAFGETKGITDWTRDRRCKVSLSGLTERLRRGWSPEEAIATRPYESPTR